MLEIYHLHSSPVTYCSTDHNCIQILHILDNCFTFYQAEQEQCLYHRPRLPESDPSTNHQNPDPPIDGDYQMDNQLSMITLPDVIVSQANDGDCMCA